ncbi:MAG: protein-glutamate O-methyltransferase CheR [Lachnospiraceae bacterium]|nr:protein-glutamate O-methyltransferase CheR [Lachnospiraceae bacterium]
MPTEPLQKDPAYEKFKKQIFELTKIDLSSYKEAQMKRRINDMIRKNSFNGYDAFVQGIKSDKKLFNDFVEHLTINVSEFYRNVDQWKLMDEQIIPSLIERFGKRLKIWSAACSTGDEPYTIVMLLSKHVPMDMIRITATDLDAEALRKAKAGMYDAKSVNGVPAEFKNKYFVKDGDKYIISDEIKRRVDFRQANLLRDPYPQDVHLIVCRNVLIYFTEEAKDDIFRKYFASLMPQGYLFIGSTEQIVQYRDIGFTRKGSFFYEKPAKV